MTSELVLVFSRIYGNYKGNPGLRFFRDGVKKISSTVMVLGIRGTRCSPFYRLNSVNWMWARHGPLYGAR